MSEAVPASERYPARVGKIAFCRRAGSGPTVVCIHGIGASKAIFSEIFSNSAFEGKELIAVDMLGHGESDRPMQATYSMEEHAAAIEELLYEVVAPDRAFWLVCHSVGGAVGVLLAKNLGERVAALVSVEGNLIASDCGLITRRTISVPFEEYREKTRQEHAREIAEKGEDPADYIATDPRAFYATAQSVVEWSDSGKLIEYFRDQMTCRRAYIYGDRNHDMEILKKLGAITAYSISNSGHCMMIDNPAEFYSTLRRSLDE